MRQAIEALFFVGLARQLEKRQASLLSHPPTSNQQDYQLYVILDDLCERSLEEGNPVQPRPTLKTPIFPFLPVVGIASCRSLIRFLIPTLSQLPIISGALTFRCSLHSSRKGTGVCNISSEEHLKAKRPSRIFRVFLMHFSTY